MDDEAPRRRTDVVERVTGDERQCVSVERAKHRHIRRLDNLRIAHLVFEIAAGGLHRQAIADADVSQRTEQTVAVRGDGTVARLPRQRRIRQVAHRHVERLLIVARHDRRQDSQPWDVQQRQDVVRSTRLCLDALEGRSRPVWIGSGGWRRRYRS